MCTAATYQTRDFYMGRTLDYEFSYGEEIVITRRGRPVARIIAEPVQPAADAAAIAAELRAFVLSQTPQARTAAEVVREARDGARY